MLHKTKQPIPRAPEIRVDLVVDTRPLRGRRRAAPARPNSLIIMSANSYNRYPDLTVSEEIARLTQNMHPPGVTGISDFCAHMKSWKGLFPGRVSGKKKVSKVLLAVRDLKRSKCMKRLAAATKTHRAAVAAAAPGDVEAPTLDAEYDWSKWMLEDLEEHGGSECTMEMIADKFSGPEVKKYVWAIMLTAYYKYKELDKDKIAAAKKAHWERQVQAAYEQLSSPEMQNILSRYRFL